jgi:hypothetical protein
LDEIKVHQREARALLGKVAASVPRSKKTKAQAAHAR